MLAKTTKQLPNANNLALKYKKYEIAAEIQFFRNGSIADREKLLKLFCYHAKQIFLSGKGHKASGKCPFCQAAKLLTLRDN